MLSIALFLALPPVVLDVLNAIAGPVLLPLVTSAVVWALNQKAKLIASWPDWAKQGFVVVTGVVLGYLGPKFGLDISSAEGFAGSLVALGIFQLGKAKGAAS